MEFLTFWKFLPSQDTFYNRPTSAMLSAVVSERMPVCSSLFYDCQNGFSVDAHAYLTAMKPKVVWMSTPNDVEPSEAYNLPLAELAKIAEWRNQFGKSFALCTPYHGLGRFSADLCHLRDQPGVQRSIVFGTEIDEAYMVLHNFPEPLFRAAHGWTALEKELSTIRSCPVDTTP